MPLPTLSPSTLGRYFFHGCEAFLVWRSGARAGAPRAVPDNSLVMRALRERGAAWEERVIDMLQARGRTVRIAAGRQPRSQRVFAVRETVVQLRDARPGDFIYQPTLRVPPGTLAAADVATWGQPLPDLLAIGVDGAVQVIDIKSAHQVSLTQKIQVWFYARLVQAMMETNGINRRVDLNKGLIWPGLAEMPQPFDMAELDPFLLRFLEVDLPRILRDPPFWALTDRCEWCDYHNHCSTVAGQSNDLSQVQGLRPQDVRGLADLAGSRSAETVARYLADPRIDDSLARHSRLAGRRAELHSRVAASATGCAALSGLASARMPTRQCIAVILLAVPDNLERRAGILGYEAINFSHPV